MPAAERRSWSDGTHARPGRRSVDYPRGKAAKQAAAASQGEAPPAGQSSSLWTSKLFGAQQMEIPCAQPLDCGTLQMLINGTHCARTARGVLRRI